MPSQTINVFVSYSHADASLVDPLVRLLRVNKSLVFQDTDRIPPGKRWRDEIAKAMAESNLVLVFWCHHSFRSNEVTTEWRTAIEQDKDVLPLLLDATPLPSELDDFQWIDFRGTVGANHSAIESPADYFRPSEGPRLMRKSPRLTIWAALAGVEAAAAVLLSGILPLPDASKVVLIWVLLSLPAVGALGAYLLWLRHRRAKREKLIESARPYSGDIKRQIAVELEAEILRRTASVQDGGA